MLPGCDRAHAFREPRVAWAHFAKGEPPMPAESAQDVVGRNRPPRVQIKYEVHTGGAPERRELPFVVGVVADLSGQPADPLPPLSQREFVKISRDNFNDVLSGCKPRVQ